ncbi:hypothetical protein GCM10027060_13650 [Nesterenkonia halophila]
MTDTDAAAGGGLLVAGMLVVAGLVLLVSYFIPTAIAMLRRHNVGGVFLVNLLLGWTFLGWVAALVMACWSKPQPTQVYVQQAPGWQQPAPQPMHWQQPGPPQR